MRNKSALIFSFFLVLAFFAGVSTAHAGTIPANHYIEDNDWTDPTNVEPLTGGGSFAATAAFRDWQQTQSVSTGAGVSGVVNTMSAESGIYNLRIGNVQSSYAGGITVTAGSYMAFAITGVGSDVSLSNVSANISSSHLSYTETNGVNHTGYVIVYFKFNAFTVTYGSTNTMNLADLVGGTNASFDQVVTVSHYDLIGEPGPSAGNIYVSSGLLDSTPEIPPQAIPAVYGGLSMAIYGVRRRFSKKVPKKPSS